MSLRVNLGLRGGENPENLIFRSLFRDQELLMVRIMGEACLIEC